MNYGARKYLEELEQENGDGEAIHQQDKVSTTDPDSTYLTKGNRAAELGYFDNDLIDNESCVIVGGASDGRPFESGECGGTRHDRSLLRTIRPATNGGGGR